jgi:hypothetical protein
VTAEGDRFLTRRQVKQLDPPLHATRGEQFAVGGERHAGDRAVMTAEGGPDGARRDVDQLHDAADLAPAGLFVAAQRQRRAVRRQGRAPDLQRRLGQRGQHLLRRRVLLIPWPPRPWKRTRIIGPPQAACRCRLTNGKGRAATKTAPMVQNGDVRRAESAPPCALSHGELHLRRRKAGPSCGPRAAIGHVGEPGPTASRLGMAVAPLCVAVPL